MAEIKIPKRVQRTLNMSSSQRRAKARQKLLDLWSTLVLARYGNRCAWCDSTRRVQAHHVVARSLLPQIAWFEVRLGMPLCYRCHIHRIKAEPDEYIQMRDAWLAARGLNYWRLRGNLNGSKRRRLTVEDMHIVELELRRELGLARKDGRA